MAAADYYMHGGGGGPHHEDYAPSPVSSPSQYHSPSPAPTGFSYTPSVTPSRTPSNLNRPLPPNPPSYHTNPSYAGSAAVAPGGGGGYGDAEPYATGHYSSQSVDTSYDPHRPDSFSSLNQLAQPAKDYSDDIPLHRTDTNSYPADANENLRATERRRQRAAGGKRAQAFPGGAKRPWFIWFISAVQVGVFIGQLIRNAQLVGSPIETHPYFNPMIGPSPFTMIEMGARYVPCMREVSGFNNDSYYDIFYCPNSTVSSLSYNTSSDGKWHAGSNPKPGCSLATACGFSGQNIPSDFGGKGGKGSAPNQWWRFIVPIFMHAGIIHLGFNLFAQIMLGGEMERKIGPLRIIAIYFPSGIFGFVMGGAVGQLGMPSVGASGSLFGIYALVWLDLFYEWKQLPNPLADLGWLLLDMVISFVIGLLPGVDNFSHIGGFICGICLGLSLLHSPPALRRRVGIADDPPYTPARPSNPYNTSNGDNQLSGAMGFIKQPVGFFKGRSGLWWAWWGVRAGALTGVLIAFIVMLNSFYTAGSACHWCKYLSCLPVNNWCSMYDLASQPNQTAVMGKSTVARALAGMAHLEL